MTVRVLPLSVTRAKILFSSIVQGTKLLSSLQPSFYYLRTLGWHRCLYILSMLRQMQIEVLVLLLLHVAAFALLSYNGVDFASAGAPVVGE